MTLEVSLPHEQQITSKYSNAPGGLRAITADDWGRNTTGSHWFRGWSLTYCTWLKECETLPPSCPYHNCPITHDHSDLTEMNSPPWGQKWSAEWYVHSGPHLCSCCLIQLGPELKVAKSIFPHRLNHCYDCRVNFLIGDEILHQVSCSDGEGGKRWGLPCLSVIAFASWYDSVELKITSVSPVCITGAHFLILSKSNRSWRPPSLNIHLTQCIHPQPCVRIYLSQPCCVHSNKLSENGSSLTIAVPHCGHFSLLLWAH